MGSISALWFPKPQASTHALLAKYDTHKIRSDLHRRLRRVGDIQNLDYASLDVGTADFT